MADELPHWPLLHVNPQREHHQSLGRDIHRSSQNILCGETIPWSNSSRKDGTLVNIYPLENLLPHTSRLSHLTTPHPCPWKHSKSLLLCPLAWYFIQVWTGWKSQSLQACGRLTTSGEILQPHIKSLCFTRGSSSIIHSWERVRVRESSEDEGMYIRRFW